MESKVRLSNFSAILTISIILILVFGCVFTFHEKQTFWILTGVTLLLLITGLLYSPVAIKVDSDNITVKSVLKKHPVPISEVESVERFQPFQAPVRYGAMRVFASGGFMGYWGVFFAHDIGRFTAYYGKSSDCFLVRLKDGSQYVLGCENPDEMIKKIIEYKR